MAYFRHVGSASGGPVAYVTGITDLDVYWMNGVARLYAVTRPGGGLSVRALTPGFDLLAARADAGSPVLAAPVQATLLEASGRPFLALTGRVESGLRGVWLGPDGQPAAAGVMTGPATGAFGALEVVTAGGRQMIITAALNSDVLTTWMPQEDGTVRAVARTAGGPQPGLDITALAGAEVAGQQYLLAVSALDSVLTVYRLGADGRLGLAGRVGAADGLGLAAPAALEVVTLGGIAYALVAGAGSSSVSVLRLRSDGLPVVTDHVIDSLDTRFQALTTLEVLAAQDRVFVIAGGADDGLSLLMLLPGGRLLHLESIADTTRTTLANVTALAAAFVNGRIEVFAAGAGKAGISRFVIDTGALAPLRQGGTGADRLTGDSRGDLLAGGAGNDSLYGGGGADILLDGAGSDHLWGGTGIDTIVLAADGVADTLHDFNLGTDRLDLSAWGMLRTVAQLDIRATADGAVIRFGIETLVLLSADGRPLDPRAFRDGHVLNLTHGGVPLSPDPPPRTGTGGGDRLTGGPGDDTLRGGAGNDSLTGSDGNDLLEGGAGRDTLSGGAQDDRLDGGTGDDSLHGGSGDDTLSGGGDRDLLQGSDGQDSLSGGLGDDRLEGGTGDDRLDGGGGADVLEGGTGADTLLGGTGDDRLGDGAGADDLTGGAGADVFVLALDGATDTIRDFRPGTDILDLTALGPLHGLQDLVIWALPGGAALRWGDEALLLLSADGRPIDPGRLTAAGVIRLQLAAAGSGTPGPDRLTGTGGNDALRGYAGNDSLYGGGGNDMLSGGIGSDLLDGGTGSDGASYAGARGLLLADLLRPETNTNHAAGDRYVSVENLSGSDGADTLRGTEGTNVLSGGSGDDWLSGRGGSDTLLGGAGDDVLTGGVGTDLVDGGAGRDRAGYADSRSALVIDLGAAARNTGDAAGDRYAGIEDVAGGTGADGIWGDATGNRIWGNEGSDRLAGAAGNDTLYGGTGADRVEGGSGDDQLYGGTGADSFIFTTGQDVVLDFSAAEGDRIGFAAALWGGGARSAATIMAQNAAVVGGDVVFTFGSNHLTLDGVTSLSGLSADIFVI